MIKIARDWSITSTGTADAYTDLVKIQAIRKTSLINALFVNNIYNKIRTLLN